MEDKWQKKPAQNQSNKKQMYAPEAEEEEISRNQNILMAILSLMRELDNGSLEIVKREAEKMLQWHFLIMY